MTTLRAALAAAICDCGDAALDRAWRAVRAVMAWTENATAHHRLAGIVGGPGWREPWA